MRSIRGMDEQLGTGLCCSSYNHTGSCQSCPGPVSGYALFYGNTYLTNEIQSEKKAEKLWKTYGSKTVQAG